jgi:hypothetical protein
VEGAFRGGKAPIGGLYRRYFGWLFLERMCLSVFPSFPNHTVDRTGKEEEKDAHHLNYRVLAVHETVELIKELNHSLLLGSTGKPCLVHVA